MSPVPGYQCWYFFDDKIHFPGATAIVTHCVCADLCLFKPWRNVFLILLMFFVMKRYKIVLKIMLLQRISPELSERLSSGLEFSVWHKESACNSGATEDVGSIPGWERSPGGGRGNPLQYSCWKNPMDSGVWWATVHRVTNSQTWLSMNTYSQNY